MPEQHIGMAVGTHAKIFAEITRWGKACTQKPVIVKLTPNVSDITEIGRAVEQAGADALAAYFRS